MFLLSLTLALAYLLVIVYASLQPLRGWRWPAADVYGFLFAPWPRYITLNDVLFNVSAYLPLGFLLTLGLRQWLRPTAAVVLGAMAATMLSIAMEHVQMFLPARVASNMDVAANSVGALIGALAAPLFAPTHAIGTRVAAMRNRVFVRGTLADAGIVLVLLWIVGFLNPWAQVFGLGQVRASIEWPTALAHTASRLQSAETLVVLFNVLGIGLMLSTLLRAEVRRGALITAVIVLALAMKSVAAWALGKPQGAWLGVTPGMLFGLGLSGALLAGMLAFSQGARLLAALVSFLLALVTVNLVPYNPYFNVPPALAGGTPTHFLSFWSIMRALSELWPMLAIGYLCIACQRHYFRARLIMRASSPPAQRGQP